MTEGIDRGHNFPMWLRVVTEASAHTERSYVCDAIKTLFFFHLAQNCSQILDRIPSSARACDSRAMLALHSSCGVALHCDISYAQKQNDQRLAAC